MNTSDPTTTEEDPSVRNLVYTCPVDHTGTSVFVKGWLIPEDNKRPVVLVHGLGESVELMAPFAKKLAARGYSVYGFDLRGHGQSGRKLGHIPSFHQLSLDLLQVVAWVKHKESGRKPIIIGQGMGSLVGLFFAKGYGKFCHSMIFVSPVFSLVDHIKSFQRFYLRTFAELLPIMMLPSRLCPQFTQIDMLSSKAPKISALLAYELLNAISQSRKQFQRHRLKSLVLCPKDDGVARYEFLKRATQKHKFTERLDLHFMETNYHHILTAKEAVITDAISVIAEWLDRNHAEEKAQNAKRRDGDNSSDLAPRGFNSSNERGTESLPSA
ncbi:MAG: alpha/beta fold hydrolase [Oligoflexales bacterium]